MRSVELGIEARTLRDASMLTTPSPRWSDLLSECFGKPARVVPNAFDPRDYPGHQPLPGRFALTWTGTWYPGKQDFKPVLGAIARLKDQRLIQPSTFVLRLVGRYLEQLNPLIEAYGVGEFVEIHDAVSHREALGMQQEASALLFLTWSDPKGVGWYSAKLYEYLGARRPILTVGPRTDASALLQQLQVGPCVTDEAGVYRALRTWLAGRDPGDPPLPGTTLELRDFTWAAAGERLAEVLEEALTIGRG